MKGIKLLVEQKSSVILRPSASLMAMIAVFFLVLAILVVVFGSLAFAADPTEVTIIGDVTIDLSDLIDVLTTLINSFLLFALIAFLLVLTFWQKSLFLYAVMTPVAIVYGLSLAAGEDSGSSLWVTGVVMSVIGMYCLFKAVYMGLQARKEPQG